MIPKILNYVWVGGPLPAVQQSYIDTWRKTNPDFQIMCWNEQNIDMSSAIIQDAYKRKKWAKVSDIARLQAVLKVGGIYLDTDFKLYKALTPLLRHRCFYVFQEKVESRDWVCNGVFGAEPNHWFVKRALDGLYSMRSLPLIPERPTTFGPKHITRLFRRVGLRDYSPDGVMVKDIYLAPVPMFFPFGDNEEFTPDCITEQTLAAHFWAKSWAHTIPLPIRLAQKLVRAVRSDRRGRTT